MENESGKLIKIDNKAEISEIQDNEILDDIIIEVEQQLTDIKNQLKKYKDTDIAAYCALMRTLAEMVKLHKSLKKDKQDDNSYIINFNITRMDKDENI